MLTQGRQVRSKTEGDGEADERTAGEGGFAEGECLFDIFIVPCLG